jgi:hypothetical protein
MSVRPFLEKDILIRLNETGFVETIRYFGLPSRITKYETRISRPAETPHPRINTDLKYALMPMRQASGRHPGEAPGRQEAI